MGFLQWIQIVYFVARAIVYIMNDKNGLKDTIIEASKNVSDVPTADGSTNGPDSTGPES